MEIPHESTQSPVLPAILKNQHYKIAEDWAQLVGKREGGRSFSRSQSSQTNADHSDKEICVVGRDRDHPTEQARSGQYSGEWQKARERE
jgi:hypothetical protein